MDLEIIGPSADRADKYPDTTYMWEFKNDSNEFIC